MSAAPILIFANPIAGRGRGQRIAKRLEARLRADGYQVILSNRRADLLDLADLPSTAKAAIVIGGDGTLRSVTDRLWCASVEAERQPGPPVLVVPLGTANLMGQHLGIKWIDQTLEDQVSAAIAGGRIVHLDAGRVNGRLFLLMVGVGFDAAVVHALDRIRRGPITMVDYALPTALTIGFYRYPALRVVVDGREVFPAAPAVAFVGNVPEYGTGFPILRDARPDDGLLDVCVLPCGSPLDMVHLALRTASGEHAMTEGAVYLKGRQVRIDTPEGIGRPVPVQIDGDPAGHAPVDIDLLPVRLPFIVP